MMLLIEIVLTIFAWKNGWRWYSLIPVGLGGLLAFTAGFAIGASGGSVDNMGWVAIFDVAAIIALIVMVSKKPKSVTNETKKLLND
jgi:hypothetical protein